MYCYFTGSYYRYLKVSLNPRRFCALTRQTVLMAGMLVSLPAIAGNYTWTYVKSVYDGDIYRISGTIWESDIEERLKNSVCDRNDGCILNFTSVNCNGLNSNQPVWNPRGEYRVDTPSDHLNKLGWQVDLEVVTCTLPGKIYPMRLSLNYYKSPDNYRGEDVILASNDGSGGEVLPPIEPEPLACSISLTTDGVISWGTLPLSELEPGKLASASARVSCSGGTEGTATARLTFSSINGRNNVVEMKNNDGDVIPAKLVMSSTGESNIAYFTVRDGYTDVHNFHARIQPYNISTYGEFKGSGLLKVEVL